MAFWRRIFEETAQSFPNVAADSAYVDAMALNLLMKPWNRITSYNVCYTKLL